MIINVGATQKKRVIKSDWLLFDGEVRNDSPHTSEAFWRFIESRWFYQKLRTDLIVMSILSLFVCCVA